MDITRFQQGLGPVLNPVIGPVVGLVLNPVLELAQGLVFALEKYM